MDQPVPRGLKTTFLLNSGIAGVVGLQHLVAPRLWTDLAGIAVEDTGLWRLIGAAVLGYAAGSALAWRARGWRSIRIVLAMQSVGSLLGATVIVWAIGYENLPPLEWLNVAILGAFGLTFTYYLASGEGAG